MVLVACDIQEIRLDELVVSSGLKLHDSRTVFPLLSGKKKGLPT